MIDWFGIWNPMVLFLMFNVDSIVKDVQQATWFTWKQL